MERRKVRNGEKERGRKKKDDATTRAAKDLFAWVGKQQYFFSFVTVTLIGCRLAGPQMSARRKEKKMAVFG